MASRARYMSESFRTACDKWPLMTKKQINLKAGSKIMLIRYEGLVTDLMGTMMRIIEYETFPFHGRPEKVNGKNMLHSTLSSARESVNLGATERGVKSQNEVDVRKYFAEREPGWTFWNTEPEQILKDTCGEAMSLLGYEIPS